MSTNSFKWYGGTSLIATLTGGGELTVASRVSTPLIYLDGIDVKQALDSKETAFIAVQPSVKSFTTQTVNGVTSTVNTIELNPSVSGIDQILYTANIGAPTTTTRSAGVKLVLYPAIETYQPDYCIGIEPFNMYFTVPDTSNGFKFYGNTNNNTTIAGNGNITTTGAIAAASAQITNNCSVGSALTSASLQTTGNCTVGGSLSVTGSLTTTSFYAPKPWFANFVTVNTLSSTVRPGFCQTGVSMTRSTTGVYVFTIPAHPSGANYMVFASCRAGDSTIVACLYTVLVSSSTSFTVWSKSVSAASLTDSNFYVFTMP